jgi:hypothetical protein
MISLGKSICINMKHNIKYLLILFCLFTITCKQQSDNNSLTNEEVEKLALEQGNLISENTQMVLGSKLKSVIQEDGVPQALKYCNVNAYPIVDSLQDVYLAKIRRASHKTRNPGDKPTNMEQKIIDGYLEDLKNKDTPSVQVIIEKKEVHYFKPIILSAALCLNCHGKIGSEITEDNYEIIKALYTEDNATGHEMGDLRGIWSIQFDRDSFQEKDVL